jgi:hypothetical protein
MEGVAQVVMPSQMSRPHSWLTMRAGELREQELEQGSQQRVPSSSHVVNTRKEASIQGHVVL